MFKKVDTDRSSAARRRRSIVVVGGGVGGLVAALLLSTRGFSVTLLERGARVGGKLHSLSVAGRPIDSGPTVFTMRWIFERIFAAAGAQLSDCLQLARADILARHSWQDGAIFDLSADRAKTAEAVAELAGSAEAQGYLAFSRHAEAVFATLNRTFLENAEPSPLGLARSAGLGGLFELARIQPFRSLSAVVAGYFRDPRLRQLFGRYATYCGSSPFAAPGPLALIAHVEQSGVWLVAGGMSRVASALEQLATERGVDVRCHTLVSEVLVRHGKAAGVMLSSGERIEADAVVFNGDPGALFGGLLGDAVRPAVAPWHPRHRSLSALTWSMVAKAEGFPLSRHTVFFSRDYRGEFVDLLERDRLPDDPTIYVCAQDRDAAGGLAPGGEERLFLLVNAPAQADRNPLSEAEIASCERTVMERLARAGLTLNAAPTMRRSTCPAEFAAMFPGSGGALYGRASHGWASSFQRPRARSRIPGLYLAGGAVHPGPGLPMAALSGSHAATAVTQDLASTVSFHPMVIPGGMPTQSARMAATR